MTTPIPEPRPGMTELDVFIDNLSHGELQILARGAIYVANAFGRHWPVSDDSPDLIDQWQEAREDIESHLPDSMPSITTRDRTRESANWYRSLFGMALLDEDGAELMCPRCGAGIQPPTDDDYRCADCKEREARDD